MTIHRLDNQITRNKVSLNDFLDGETPRGVKSDDIDEIFSGTKLR